MLNQCLQISVSDENETDPDRLEIFDALFAAGYILEEI